jgi:hypothetical protein
MEMHDFKKDIVKMLEEMHAVTVLEYHDKNLLSGDNKSRNEWLQERLLERKENIQSNTKNYEICD